MSSIVKERLFDSIVTNYLEALIDRDWEAMSTLRTLASSLAQSTREPDFAALAVSIDDDVREAWPTP